LAIAVVLKVAVPTEIDVAPTVNARGGGGGARVVGVDYARDGGAGAVAPGVAADGGPTRRHRRQHQHGDRCSDQCRALPRLVLPKYP